MRFYDPFKDYNPNFSEEEWHAHKHDERTRAVCDSISTILSTGMVAAITEESLSMINFDVRAKLGWPAPLLQESWHSHFTAWAIAALTHACFSNDTDGKVRFYTSPYNNEPYVPGNVTFLTPEPGRAFGQAILKSQKKQQELAQLELFEF
jgi:hypothetical protein